MAYLINTIAQVKEYVNVGNGLSIQTLRPALNEVQMQELTFYLGADLLAEVIAQVNSQPQTFTPRIEKIYKYVMAAACGLALYKGGPEIEVLISDNGINRQESENEKTAYGGQVKRVLDMAANRGYKAIDAFLLILETYAQDYPEWQDSQYFALREGMMIRTALEYEQAGEGIKNSSLTFQALLPILRGIQENRIKDALPEALYLDLLANPSTPKNEYLLKNYIRPALAKLTTEEALTILPVELDHESVTVNQLALAGDARTNLSAPLHLIEKKAWGLRGRGEYYLSRMKEFLNETASSTNYPEWFISDHYEETLKAQIIKNKLEPHQRKIYR